MALFGNRTGAQAPARIARFAEGRVGYAVGDIHGRADLLTKLLARLEEEPRTGDEAPIVIFLGDYVDRGPDSAGVLDLLMTPRPRGFERRFLLGNHEAAMLAFMEEPARYRDWLKHGGVQTLLSYGVRPPPLAGPSEALAGAAHDLKARMPAAHREFLSRLDRYVTYGDYAFVHAGVDPAKPLDAQSDQDLLWIREKFIDSKRAASHVIVHGHTPIDQPHRDHRRIGVDTGAYATGRLTAVKLHGEDAAFIQVGPL